jgi:hypothetical protein
MADYKPPAISDIAMTENKKQALIDARDIIRELGMVVYVRLNEEANVERDSFNSIIRTDKTKLPGLPFYSFPIIYNPTEKQLSDSGIREKCQVLIKTAVLDWNDAGYTMETLKPINLIRASISIAGVEYEIVDTQLDSQYVDTYLYIHIGLNRK